MSHLALYHYNHSKRGTLNEERGLKRIKTYGTYCFKLSYLQIKRKIPLQPNGSSPPAGELEKEEDHHAGPELQRTGRWVCNGDIIKHLSSQLLFPVWKWLVLFIVLFIILSCMGLFMVLGCSKMKFLWIQSYQPNHFSNRAFIKIWKGMKCEILEARH